MKNDVSLGQAHEAAITLDKAGATVSNFWDPIAKSEVLAAQVVNFIKRAIAPVFCLRSNNLGYHERTKDWELVFDLGDSYGAPFALELLEVDEVLGGFKRTDAEKLFCADIDSILHYAKESGEYGGQRHAESMINVTDGIPEEFRKYSLVFIGTAWKAEHGRLCVPCLVFKKGEWVFYFKYLQNGLSSRCRIVRVIGV
jgi:hypothetical protein